METQNTNAEKIISDENIPIPQSTDERMAFIEDGVSLLIGKFLRVCRTTDDVRDIKYLTGIAENLISITKSQQEKDEYTEKIIAMLNIATDGNH